MRRRNERQKRRGSASSPFFLSLLPLLLILLCSLVKSDVIEVTFLETFVDETYQVSGSTSLNFDGATAASDYILDAVNILGGERDDVLICNAGVIAEVTTSSAGTQLTSNSVGDINCNLQLTFGGLDYGTGDIQTDNSFDFSLVEFVTFEYTSIGIVSMDLGFEMCGPSGVFETVHATEPALTGASSAVFYLSDFKTLTFSDIAAAQLFITISSSSTIDLTFTQFTVTPFLPLTEVVSMIEIIPNVQIIVLPNLDPAPDSVSTSSYITDANFILGGERDDTIEYPSGFVYSVALDPDQGTSVTITSIPTAPSTMEYIMVFDGSDNGDPQINLSNSFDFSEVESITISYIFGDGVTQTDLLITLYSNSLIEHSATQTGELASSTSHYAVFPLTNADFGISDFSDVSALKVHFSVIFETPTTFGFSMSLTFISPPASSVLTFIEIYADETYIMSAETSLSISPDNHFGSVRDYISDPDNIFGTERDDTLSNLGTPGTASVTTSSSGVILDILEDTGFYRVVVLSMVYDGIDNGNPNINLYNSFDLSSFESLSIEFTFSAPDGDPQIQFQLTLYAVDGTYVVKIIQDFSPVSPVKFDLSTFPPIPLYNIAAIQIDLLVLTYNSVTVTISNLVLTNILPISQEVFFIDNFDSNENYINANPSDIILQTAGSVTDYVFASLDILGGERDDTLSCVCNSDFYAQVIASGAPEINVVPESSPVTVDYYMVYDGVDYGNPKVNLMNNFDLSLVKSITITYSIELGNPSPFKFEISLITQSLPQWIMEDGDSTIGEHTLTFDLSEYTDISLGEVAAIQIRTSFVTSTPTMVIIDEITLDFLYPPIDVLVTFLELFETVSYIPSSPLQFTSPGSTTNYVQNSNHILGTERDVMISCEDSGTQVSMHTDTSGLQIDLQTASMTTVEISFVYDGLDDGNSYINLLNTFDLSKVISIEIDYLLDADVDTLEFEITLYTLYTSQTVTIPGSVLPGAYFVQFPLSSFTSIQSLKAVAAIEVNINVQTANDVNLALSKYLLKLYSQGLIYGNQIEIFKDETYVVSQTSDLILNGIGSISDYISDRSTPDIILGSERDDTLSCSEDTSSVTLTGSTDDGVILAIVTEDLETEVNLVMTFDGVDNGALTRNLFNRFVFTSIKSITLDFSFDENVFDTVEVGITLYMSDSTSQYQSTMTNGVEIPLSSFPLISIYNVAAVDIVVKITTKKSFTFTLNQITINHLDSVNDLTPTLLETFDQNEVYVMADDTTLSLPVSSRQSVTDYIYNAQNILGNERDDVISCSGNCQGTTKISSSTQSTGVSAYISSIDVNDGALTMTMSMVYDGIDYGDPGVLQTNRFDLSAVRGINIGYSLSGPVTSTSIFVSVYIGGSKISNTITGNVAQGSYQALFPLSAFPSDISVVNAIEVILNVVTTDDVTITLSSLTLDIFPFVIQKATFLERFNQVETYVTASSSSIQLTATGSVSDYIFNTVNILGSERDDTLTNIDDNSITSTETSSNGISIEITSVTSETSVSLDMIYDGVDDGRPSLVLTNIFDFSNVNNINIPFTLSAEVEDLSFYVTFYDAERNFQTIDYSGTSSVTIALVDFYGIDVTFIAAVEIEIKITTSNDVTFTLSDYIFSFINPEDICSPYILPDPFPCKIGNAKMIPIRSMIAPASSAGSVELGLSNGNTYSVITNLQYGVDYVFSVGDVNGGACPKGIDSILVLTDPEDNILATNDDCFTETGCTTSALIHYVHSSDQFNSVILYVYGKNSDGDLLCYSAGGKVPVYMSVGDDSEVDACTPFLECQPSVQYSAGQNVTGIDFLKNYNLCGISNTPSTIVLFSINGGDFITDVIASCGLGTQNVKVELYGLYTCNSKITVNPSTPTVECVKGVQEIYPNFLISNCPFGVPCAFQSFDYSPVVYAENYCGLSSSVVKVDYIVDNQWGVLGDSVVYDVITTPVSDNSFEDHTYCSIVYRGMQITSVIDHSLKEEDDGYGETLQSGVAIDYGTQYDVLLNVSISSNCNATNPCDFALFFLEQGAPANEITSYYYLKGTVSGTCKSTTCSAVPLNFIVDRSVPTGYYSLVALTSDTATFSISNTLPVTGEIYDPETGDVSPGQPLTNGTVFYPDALKKRSILNDKRGATVYTISIGNPVFYLNGDQPI